MALVHQDDRELVAQEIQTMLAEHGGFDFTKRIARPGGSIRHVRCVGSPATSGGIFQGFVGAGIDVTEHEALTKALRQDFTVGDISLVSRLSAPVDSVEPLLTRLSV